MIALIPAYCDAYTLYFCLKSIVNHFDQIVVYDDGSFDETTQVAFCFQRQYPHVGLVVNPNKSQGWIEARNQLLKIAADEKDLFFIDADDIFCEYMKDDLKAIAAIGRPTLLRLYDLWGDWSHGTQYGNHYDPCHIYVPDAACLQWVGSTPDGHSARPKVGGPILRWPNTLFFHAKGVKPDFRIYLRHYIKPWIMAGRPYPLIEWCDLIHKTGQEIHKEAFHILTHASNRIVPFNPKTPSLPQVIEEELKDPMMFFEYNGNKIVDRVQRDRSMDFYCNLL